MLQLITKKKWFISKSAINYNMGKLKLLSLILFLTSLNASALRDIFDASGPANGYDKYVILEPGFTYTGEIGIFEGKVFIEGNGAIVDLEGGVGIWVYAEENYPASLDIEYLTISNGSYNGLTYNGTSTGNVINCNFINNDFGIQIMDNVNLNVKNSNFINNSSYGIAIRGTTTTFDISYSNFWGNVSGCGGFNENCWGVTWTQFELDNFTEINEFDPLFIDVNDWDFSYEDFSPCIDAGDPNLNDPDETRSDIGAIFFNQNECVGESGDINNDNIINILDIVSITNYILNQESFNSECLEYLSDMNQDGIVNILDVVAMVNIILNF